MKMKIPDREDDFEYRKLANTFVGLIQDGTLLPGARIPSLRQTSVQQRVSVTTALKAYRLLEDSGYLKASPKSGYFVSDPAPTLLDVPTTAKSPMRERSVSLSKIMMTLLECAGDPAFVPLGCTTSRSRLLAPENLDRSLVRTTRRQGTDQNTHTSPKGDVHLRQQIARRSLTWGGAFSYEDIMITNGCTEAVIIALQTVTKPGDTVAVESPTYFGNLHTMQTLKLRAYELPTDATTGIDIEALEKALQQQAITACLLPPSFSNPLGFTMSDEKKIAILKLLKQHRIPLIEDDAAGEVYFGKARPRPFCALDPSADVLYCSSFSKTLAPGYRVGWIATRQHIDKVLDKKFMTTLYSPSLSQLALAEFLSSGGYDNHLRKLRRKLEDALDRMRQAVSVTFPRDTRISGAAGGNALWLELPGTIDTLELFYLALDEGICIAPGEIFSVSDRYSNCLRLSAAHGWDAKTEAGVTALGMLVENMMQG
jgi:DNA-binding transcriptional MocR family regulator